ncbi:MAG: alpha/beta hydrolase, partial [Candidatus Kapaibacterium sp.]
MMISFTFSGTKEKGLSGSWCSPVQSPMQDSMSFVMISGDSLHVIIAKANGRYDAKISGNVITGTWMQATTPIPLVMYRPQLFLGTLKAGIVELRLGIELLRLPAGRTIGTLVSVDQGMLDLPIDSLVLGDTSFFFRVSAVKGKYYGSTTKEHTFFKGTWEQGPQAIPLELELVDKFPATMKPQDPVKPYPYDEEDVTYFNPAGNDTLAGTLTIPRTTGQHPVVLLITGSGPQDRNETLLGHHPFWVLADYLTRQGIEVLRVDDRGTGASTGKFLDATSGDFATDVEAGITFLKTRKEINKKQIGLLGHSEGGMIAPMVAARSSDVAFVVLLAGPGVPSRQLMRLQREALMKVTGAPLDSLRSQLDLNSSIDSIVASEPNDSLARIAITPLWDNLIDAQLRTAKVSEKERADFELHKDEMMKPILAPWYRFWIRRDPRIDIKKLQIPVLAINGSKDVQVVAKENLHGIETALKLGGNKDYKVQELEGLNHLFQTAPTGAVTEYAGIKETMSPVAMKVIGDWVVAHTLAKK